MDDAFDWLDAEWERWRAQQLFRPLRRRESPSGATVTLDGHELVNFGSNDYLGLASDPRLVAAVREVLEATAWGAGASPLVSGRGVWHARLEARLAAFEGTEAALLFPTGYAANVGTVSALMSRGDRIFSDAKNHASIIDGCRLSGARVEIYRHADAAHLATLLQASPPARRTLIVTDGLFSMDGDLAPLPALVELAGQYQAMLMVDEAHATGVFGATGRGVCEHFGLDAQVPIRVGTLSKALGSMGGFVAGSQRLVDWLSNRARTYVFSTAAPEALAVAGHRALELAVAEPGRRAALLSTAAALREQLRQQGWDLGRSATQIIPVMLGDAEDTLRCARQLQESGFFVPPIRPPSVPPGESLLRISLSAAHTPQMVHALVDTFRGLRDHTRRTGL